MDENDKLKLKARAMQRGREGVNAMRVSNDETEKPPKALFASDE